MALLPLSLVLLAFDREYPDAVHFSVLPVSDPLLVLAQSEFSVPVPLVVAELAIVLPAVSPVVDAFAIHHAVLPLPAVLPAVPPEVDSFTVEFVFLQLAHIRLRDDFKVFFIIAAVPRVLALAFFESVSVAAFEHSPVGPDFLALAMRLSVHEEAFVAVVLARDPLSEAIQFAVVEVSLLDATILVDLPAVPVGLARDVHSFIIILFAIENTEPLRMSFLPLAKVEGLSPDQKERVDGRLEVLEINQ